MLRPLALALLLAPALASAQVTITESSNFRNGNDEIINAAECEGTVSSSFTIQFRVPTTTSVNVDLKISDVANCPQNSTENPSKTQPLQSFSTNSGNLTNQSAQSLIRLLGFGCGDGVSRPVYICAVPSTNGTQGSVVSATVTLDGVKPGKPKITVVTPGDAALEVAWDPVSGSNRYEVIATDPATNTQRSSGELTNETAHRLDKLTIGTPYDVRVFAISVGGNRSDASEPVSGTPVEVQDFWRLYQGAEGRDEGGCSTGGAGPLALLALAALALRRRARRILPLLLLVAALPASAQEARRVESPRWGSFELKALPYRPNVDAEFEGCDPSTRPVCDPYQVAFGGGRKAMFRAEVAKTIFYQYGSLDLGLGTGWWQVRGRGRQPNGSPSTDRTSFRIVPTSLYLTYRLDLLAERWSIPFAPYAKVGFERYNWWVTGGSGGTTSAAGKRGRGATNGYSYGAGLAFLLDIVDRGLAVEMDRDTGVNHTYLFVEAMKYQVDDFGSKSSMDLSTDRTFAVGGGLLFVF